VKENLTELVLPSRVESVEEAAVMAAKLAMQFGMDNNLLFGIDLAVREAVANAIKHGNQEDETKTVLVSFSKLATAFEIIVKDEGAGFDVSQLPDPTDPSNLLKSSGRGIFLMKNFMDEVNLTSHPSGGMVVIMTVNFSS
jgi:serine/threonine-protein kinase RsbW